MNHGNAASQICGAAIKITQSSTMSLKHLTIAAALQKLVVLGMDFLPSIRIFHTAGDSPQFAVTLIGMSIALKWSKIVVATISAMIGFEIRVDLVRCGIDLLKPNAIKNLFLAACFAFSAVLLFVTLLLARKHRKAVCAQ